MKRTGSHPTILLVLLPILAGAGPTSSSRTAEGAAVDAERIIHADREPGSWLAHGRTYAEQRFSPLDAINAGNVDELGLAWYWETGARRGLEATPLVVDGVMYTTGEWSRVYALDAKTGELLWKHDPEVPKEWGVKACCDVVNRGVAVWRGKVFVGTIDGRLVALDADTGEVVWERNTIDRSKPYTITGAPRVVKGKVIIGNGGADFGVRGYVTAYDAGTGEKAWRFYTVPGDPADGFESEAMKMAAGTWYGEWWKAGGGGTVWDSMAYDPELDLLYIGVGNGSPWNREVRSEGRGDNLFLSSIVALDPDTGEYVWHFQTTPGDRWDYTATQHMILADLKIDGETRKVIMQAPKNGFFYVLDRRTGEFISAKRYVPVNWAEGVDPETGRPVGVRDYDEEPRLTLPSPFGGHNWHPMSYNPDTGLVYIPTLEMPFTYAEDDTWEYNVKAWNTGVKMAKNAPPANIDQLLNEKIARAMSKGQLKAWDPVKQKVVWRVSHKGPWNGGTLATAGNLVFQGTADGRFVAYRADDGEQLWETGTRSGIIAPPITYTVGGRQYVTVMAGWGGAFGLGGGAAAQLGGAGAPGRVLTYRLGGEAELPPKRNSRPIPDPPPVQASEATLERGNKLYHRNCGVCHGSAVVGSSNLPDLRYMSDETHRKFNAIVLGGIYRDRGMVSFASVLDVKDAEAIHEYIKLRAHEERDHRQASAWWRSVKSFFYGIVAWFVTVFT